MRSLHAQHGYHRTEVAISTDPGRFVCNYLYFRSLEFCRRRGPHTAVSEEERDESRLNCGWPSCRCVDDR